MEAQLWHSWAHLYILNKNVLFTKYVNKTFTYFAVSVARQQSKYEVVTEMQLIRATSNLLLYTATILIL